MAGHIVMIIRHGEKPPKSGLAPFGVTLAGERNDDSLSPLGWQRAGALAHYFVDPPAPLARPRALFAAGSVKGFTSRRNVETGGPIAARLGLALDARFAPDEVEAAATAIMATPGPALAVWRHRNIAGLVAAFTGDASLAPLWPGDRFDVTLVLQREAGRWRLIQVPQRLLAGDAETGFGSEPATTVHS